MAFGLGRGAWHFGVQTVAAAFAAAVVPFVSVLLSSVVGGWGVETVVDASHNHRGTSMGNLDSSMRKLDSKRVLVRATTCTPVALSICLAL